MPGELNASSPLRDWLSHLEHLHPETIELGLERVRSVWQVMGAPRIAMQVVTIAGTNGKGSCIAMLETMLHAAGYRVGSYTSPHLLRFNERVRVNAVDAEDTAITAALQVVEQARGEISLTYFEFSTLAALYLFAHSDLEVALLEVGLGGRLDAVNIIDADIALITPIDIDHTDWLGHEREEIAREKAGIIRAGHTVVCADPQPPSAILAVADELEAPLLVPGRDFGYRVDNDGRWSWWLHDERGDWQLGELPAPALLGEFQYANAAAVLAVLCRLSAGPLTLAAIHHGLREVRLPGRYQQIASQPVILVDVAHNPHSARALAAQLARTAGAGRTLAVFGVMADKDIAAIIAPLVAQVAAWYVASPAVLRAAGVGDLVELLREAGAGELHAAQNVAGALAMARQAAAAADRIIVFGSFYTVAEAMQEPV